MSVTADFAACLSELAAKGLDDAARASALALVLDGISVAALGASELGPSILADAAVEPANGPSASMIGRTSRSSASDAARVNGASMHVLDFEPMWNPANHSLSTTLPALLAMAETQADDEGGPLGARILTALAVGIEAQERLRLSSRQFEPGGLVFHPPGAVGPFGSAVACGLLMKLDQARLTHAIAIAASRAGGVQANIGSMTKALHCGQAAAAGLESAAFAARGFTADADALGDPRGYGKAFFGDAFTPAELTRHHDALQIVHPGPAFKLYPSQYGTHFVITAALAARAALAPASKIVRVVIDSPSMPYVDRPNPATGLAGKFSFQYTAAVALLDGVVNVASFTDRRRFAADVVDLLPRIVIKPDASRQGRFDAMTLAIHVETDRGSASGACDGPPGIWGRPVPAERLRAKAADCLSTALGAAAASEIMAFADRFARLDRAGVCRLMDLLAQPARGAKAS